MIDLGSDDIRPAILVVDDKRENLIAMETLLRELEIEVISAQSGREALNIALQRGDIAIFLLDVHMPEMDGFELAEMLRLNESTEGTPIIFLSAAYKSNDFAFKGYQVGAIDYLPKPVPDEILLSKVSFFLEAKRQRLKLERAQRERAESNAILADANERLGSQNRQLALALSELESRNQIIRKSTVALQEFARAMTHNPEAPLKKIRRYLEDARSGRPTSWDEVTDAAEAMQGMLWKLTDYTDVIANPPSSERVRLNDLVDDVLLDVSDTVDRMSAAVEVEDLPNVSGDPVLLRRLFRQVIETRLGDQSTGASLRIEIQAEKSSREDFCTIVLNDNGRAYTKEEIARLLEPAHQIQTSRITGDAGWGLALAHEIASLHQGSIEANPRECGGLSLRVVLPTAS